MKKFSQIVWVLFFSLISIQIVGQDKQVKNVILMIPDGTSVDVLSIVRWYRQGKLNAVDPYICGLVRTHSSDAPIGDSAPTGSAYATGYLSRSGYISSYPDATLNDIYPVDKTKAFQPLFTILEAAKLNGKSTGLVFTCYFPHATPASFASHYPDRQQYEILAKQMVYNQPDVVFGGGIKYIKKRADGIDMSNVLKQNKVFYTESVSDFQKFDGTQIWALFANEDLANDFDRNPAIEPSISEMTEKAITILSKNPKGFFLMVEGSKVDWSAHDNDPIGVISEFMAFDNAVKKAIEFAIKDGSTAVIILPDHGNGGIALGNNSINKGYDKKSYNELFANILKCKNTAEIFKSLYPEKPTKQAIIDSFKNMYGIENLTDKEIETIQAFYDKLPDEKKVKDSMEIVKIVAKIITNRTAIGWTSLGHTGEDVFLAIYHPKGYRPTGLVQNTDVNKYICEILGNYSLDSLTNLYYVPAGELFKNYSTSIDSSNVFETVFVVKNKTTELRIPANKSEIWITKTPDKNRKVVPIKTVMIYNGKGFYVPQYLLELMKN